MTEVEEKKKAEAAEVEEKKKQAEAMEALMKREKGMKLEQEFKLKLE